MTKRRTKHALLMSGLALLLCVSMLVGSTYAWFTDSVTSTGNIIKSGTLDVTMMWKDATAAGAQQTYKDASEGAIFNYNKWEPGYVEAKNISIANVGTLALKYQLNIVANGDASELAKAIDVYYADGEKTLVSRDLEAEGLTYLGTLDNVLAQISTTAAGNLVSGANHTVTLALKMQESAGNDYQDKSIGSTFSVQLMATQLTSETDSFDDQYDVDSDYVTSASTVDELLTALKAGGNVILANDITLPEGVSLVVPAGTVASLDLNGKTIDAGYQTGSTVKHTYAIENRGTLTLKNGTVNARGIANYGNLKVESGTYNAIDTNGGAAIWNYENSSVIVNGGTFTSADASAAPAACVMNVADNCTAVINGGNFVANADWTYAIINNGDVTVNGGKFTSEHGVFTAENGGELTVTDGEFEITASGHVIYVIGGKATLNGGSYKHSQVGASGEGNVILYVGSGTAAVNGGSYDSVEAAFSYASMANAVVVKGGKFANSATKAYTDANGINVFVADGYKATDDNGTLTVEKQDLVYDSTVMGSLYDYLPTLESGDVLILPEQTYVTSGTFTVPAGVTIKGAEGAEVIIRQISSAQDNIFNCEGDAVIENITFETNRKGYAITDNTNDHDTDGDITVRNCKFKGIGTDKNWGIYKNLNGNLTVENCTFDNYNNALCGINNGAGSTTTVTGCTFTNINAEAIGYVMSTMPADFESVVIANNTGLTEQNVIGY